jgi:hypothetical protein
LSHASLPVIENAPEGEKTRSGSAWQSDCRFGDQAKILETEKEKSQKD